MRVRPSYRLRIEVPHRFPGELPRTLEIGGRISRDAGHQVSSDGSLCLGSPLRLHLIARETRDLTVFVHRSIVPYLYAASYRERTGGPYVFGELDHDAKGLLEDYAEVLRLRTPREAFDALALLGTKRRLANKRPCPSRCGRRLGVSGFNATIRSLRSEFGRTRFKRLYNQVFNS